MVAVATLVGSAGLAFAADPPAAKAPSAGKAPPPAKASPAIAPIDPKPASTADASAAPGPSSAEELFRKGSELYTAQKWSEAEEAFRGAWKLQKTYDIAANLGHTEYKLEKWRDAATHLAFAIRSWPVAGKPEPRELAKQRFEEVRAKVAAVSIQVSVAGAEVLVDGTSAGTSPLGADIYVEPGDHRVEAKLPGYKLASAPVQGVAGGTQSVRLELTREVTDAPPPLSKGTRTGLLIGGAVVSAVGLGMGIGFTIAANNKGDEAAALLNALKAETPADATVCSAPAGSGSQTCKDLYATVEKQQKLGNIAMGSYIAGGALALATAGFGVWLGTRPSTAKAAVRVAPVVSASQQGLVVVGRW